MLTINNPFASHLPDEKSFTVHDVPPIRFSDASPSYVHVHPWHRRKDSEDEDFSVAIEVGYENGENSITIVDRWEFIQGLLEVFPELEFKEWRED